MCQLPEAFKKWMESLLGEEYGSFLASYEEKRVQGLRVNPLKTCEGVQKLEEEGFHLKKIPWTDEGYYYDTGERPGKHPYHEAGMYYIQEPSAMAVGELADAAGGERILDLCAAPGGKTTHIAGKMMGKGFLVSNEIHPARARILSQNVERMGIGNAIVVNEDSAALASRFPEFFDKIILDAPCSGEGMFRKDEEARNQWSQEHVNLCAERQTEILENAARMLRSGGRLVYSTCTFAPEENEQVLAGFLKSHWEFEMIRPEGAWEGFAPGCPQWAGAKAKPEQHLERAYRLWPHKIEGEGHFIAVMEKRGCKTEEVPGEAGRQKKNRVREKTEKIEKDGWKTYQIFCQETLVKEAADGLLGRQAEDYVLFGDQLYLLPEGFRAAIGEKGLSGLKVLRPGLHLGTFKKQRFEPSHALALYLKPKDAKLGISLSPDSGEGAQAYLKGSTLPAADLAEKAAKGWVLVSVGGCSLGWAKLSGGILKNHYPKGLRWN